LFVLGLLFTGRRDFFQRGGRWGERGAKKKRGTGTGNGNSKNAGDGERKNWKRQIKKTKNGEQGEKRSGNGKDPLNKILVFRIYF
jgi:hypothetical protein